MLKDSSSKNVLSGYAFYLAEHQLLDKQIALNALQQANSEKCSYIEYLVKEHLLDEKQVGQTTADYFGLPFCDINSFNLDLVPNEYLNIQLVKKKTRIAFIYQKRIALFCYYRSDN